jgi:hypothetical protein
MWDKRRREKKVNQNYTKHIKIKTNKRKRRKKKKPLREEHDQNTLGIFCNLKLHSSQLTSDLDEHCTP